MPMPPADPTPDSPRSETRRPYERPRIVNRANLEAIAATCTQPGGKMDPIMCPMGPLQS